MSTLWKAVPVRSITRGTPGETWRRKTVQMRAMSQAVQPQDRPSTPHVSAQWLETICVRAMRQGIHPQGSHVEALRNTQKEIGSSYEENNQRKADHPYPLKGTHGGRRMTMGSNPLSHARAVIGATDGQWTSNVSFIDRMGNVYESSCSHAFFVCRNFKEIYFKCQRFLSQETKLPT